MVALMQDVNKAHHPRHHVLKKRCEAQLSERKNYNPHLNADSVLLICHMNFISCSKKTRLIHSCALNFQKQSTFECRFGTLIFLLDMCHFTFAQKNFATINNKSLQVLPKCSENVRIVECSPAHLLSMTEAFCRKINMSFGPQIALDL